MMHVGAPDWIHGLWVVPALIVLMLWSSARTRTMLSRFAQPDLAAHIASATSLSRFRLCNALLVIAVALVVIGLCRPQFNEREVTLTRSGREVVFVIDVSRSMLASDLAPNRLERAKIWIRDMLPEIRGDSIGLVAFAGAASVKAPLSTDYGFFELALSELAPESVPVGGTMIGDALRKTVSQVFERSSDDERPDGVVRDIILFTDGEDQGSLPIPAAEAAAASGIRIIAIGLGSETSGAAVPSAREVEQYATYEGETVRSRLDAATLAAIAQTTPGGVFINVGTGNIALDAVYRDLVTAGEQRSLDASSAMVYDEYFWVCLAGAFVALLAEALLRRGGRAPAALQTGVGS